MKEQLLKYALFENITSKLKKEIKAPTTTHFMQSVIILISRSESDQKTDIQNIRN